MYYVSNLTNHLQAAKEARYDKEAVVKFFRLVCNRWLVSCSSSSEGYKYDVLPLLPAHRSLTPPAPTLYPQLQPLSVPPENYSFHRLAATGLPRISSTKLNKADTNN
ncbi:hypothetical protein BHE74_00043388 [Ensete ventricosum]|uniref:Uncharacterized protein n=1 Tax=Ensete ventricosum TaxID=4639 RepID=A0A427A129_ENSVE|nr:hypothetical protein B296_00025924 [Ensete ventricosum]RWW50367.1 hypothetical protein BHE74_00043388 [Ensete ventricosum]